MKPTDLQIGDWVEKDMNYSEEAVKCADALVKELKGE